MSIITIIGAGMMGSALTFPARERGNTVRLVGTPFDRNIIAHARKSGEHLTLGRLLPGGIEYFQTECTDDALFGADLVVGGVSSFGVDWFIQNIIPRIPESIPVLSITKGMENRPGGSLISYLEVFEASSDRNISFNAVGGPCTSHELADREQTAVTFCGRDIETLRRIKAMLETDYYHISLSTDLRGVGCAAAMKNAYALAVTLAVGLSHRRQGREYEAYNPQSALFGQSMREMSLIIELCGGSQTSLPLGAGDLYVTIFGGRTRKIGRLLGTGIPFNDAMEKLSGVTLESVVIARRTALAVREMIAAGRAAMSDFPLLLHVESLINGGEEISIPWKDFESESFI